MLTKEEVPHAITCLIENISYKKDSVYINALIIVDRDNLKKNYYRKTRFYVKKDWKCITSRN